jgi:hypothetical protein
LQTKKENVTKAEIAQQPAVAEAIAVTTPASDLLDEVYREASSIADFLCGLYGKGSEVVKKIRKIRK